MSDRGGDNNFFFFAKREGLQIRKMDLNKKDATTQTEEDILHMTDNSVKTEICSPKQDSEDMMDDSVESAQKLGAYTQVASAQKDKLNIVNCKEEIEHCKLHSRCNIEGSIHGKAYALKKENIRIQKWNQTLILVQQRLLYEIETSKQSMREKETFKAMMKDIVKLTLPLKSENDYL